MKFGDRSISRKRTHFTDLLRPIASATLALGAWVLLTTIFANAQVTGLGSISGTVSDSSGAVVAGAKVTITNVETGVVQGTVTNNAGYFEVGSLTPGEYKISAASPSFATLVRTGVTLLADARINVPLILKPGSEAQQIVVTADAALLNTEGSDSGEVFTTQQLQSLPIAGNNPNIVQMIAPGTQSQMSQLYTRQNTISWSGYSGFGSFGQIQQNEYSLDGTPNQVTQGAGHPGAAGVNLTSDQIGEMKVDTTGFDPAFGHALGVQQTVFTKNGTNDLHGTLREFYQDWRWGALNHFQGAQYHYELQKYGCVNGPSTSPKCLHVEYQYGNPGTHEHAPAAAIGGPVVIPGLFNGRNKLFFFASYLYDTSENSVSKAISTPTALERTGDFSDLPKSTSTPPSDFTSACGTGATWYGQYQLYNPFSVALVNGVPKRTPFCGNIIPASLLSTNSAMAKVFNTLSPLPNTGAVTGSNYQYSDLGPQTFNDLTWRIDYSISPSNHVFARYSKEWYAKTDIGFMPKGLSDQSGPRYINSGSIDWTHIFSSNMELDVTAGLTDFRSGCCYYPSLSQYSPTSLGLPSYLNDYDTYQGKIEAMPIMSPTSYTAIGFTNKAVQGFDDRTYALRTNLMRLMGRHTIRADFEGRLQGYSNTGLGNINGTYTFDDAYLQHDNGTNTSYPTNNVGLSYAALLLGIQTKSSVNQAASVSTSTPYYAAYVGDTWRVTPRLTIMPGIRYEFEFGPAEKRNAQIVAWDPTASLPIASPAETAYQSAFSGATSAQQAVLPTSLTIQGGPVYAGVNGASTRQWQNSYRIMPRVGLAYQLTNKTVLRAGYGLIYGTLNAILESGYTDQDGFSATTSSASSTTYGTNFSAGSTPLSNPFPNGFVPPIASAAGLMNYAGSNPSIYDHSLTPPKAERGEVSIQHQFGASSMLEIAWLGQFTTHEMVKRNASPLPASFYASGHSMQPNTATAALLATQIANPFYIGNFSALASSNPAQYSVIAASSYFSAKRSISPTWYVPIHRWRG